MNRTGSQDVELEAKVRFLASPGSYPEGTGRVEPVETHMSWIFLTDRHAYKLKKPVRYAYLDFTTLAARKTFCEAEVRLNRRLAPTVYLGTVPLTCERAGALALGGEGKPVDWLVRMRRLNAEATLERRIEAGSLRNEEFAAVAERLAQFYRSLERVPLSPFGYLGRFGGEIARSFGELSRPEYGLDQAQLVALRERQLAALETLQPRLEERASRVVEGHGDLRAEHVWIEDPPVIIDCLEFDRELRLVDPLDDLGFLALECARLGRPDLQSPLLAAYARATPDRIDTDLLRFYQSVRAALRARLAIQHLREARFLVSDHWREHARTWVDLALDRTGSPGSDAVNAAHPDAGPDPGAPG